MVSTRNFNPTVAVPKLGLWCLCAVKRRATQRNLSSASQWFRMFIFSWLPNHGMNNLMVVDKQPPPFVGEWHNSQDQRSTWGIIPVKKAEERLTKEKRAEQPSGERNKIQIQTQFRYCFYWIYFVGVRSAQNDLIPIVVDGIPLSCEHNLRNVFVDSLT